MTRTSHPPDDLSEVGAPADAEALYRATVLRMLEAHGYRAVAMARLFGTGLSFAPGLRWMRFVAGAARESVEHGAAIVAVRAHDTVKQVAPLDGALIITRTIPRDEVYLAQTPQGFRRDVLARALALSATHEATDEASLVEALGLKVAIVPGDATNIKVTVPADLVLAGAIAGTRANTADRKVE